MTTFITGLATTADLLESELITGPDGNLWFTDEGTPKAIGRINVQAPPTAVTGADMLTSTGATLQGTVNPRGASTTARFEYGTTPALGSSVTAATLAASGDPSPVSAAITGLTGGTTIYYRAAAANDYGTTPGAIRSFTTPRGGPDQRAGSRAGRTQAHDDDGEGRQPAHLARSRRRRPPARPRGDGCR